MEAGSGQQLDPLVRTAARLEVNGLEGLFRLFFTSAALILVEYCRI